MITLHVTLTILITYRFLKRFYINKIDDLATKCGLFKSENCVPIFYMAFFLFKIGVTGLAIRYLRIAAFLPVQYMQKLLPPSLPLIIITCHTPPHYTLYISVLLVDACSMIVVFTNKIDMLSANFNWKREVNLDLNQ